jgi:23S rRNA (uracil1939-C5)-methyltransferase
MISPGQLVRLTVEKPAAGGRMIARVDGQVVLVAGAIPGERLTARIERIGRGVAYAEASSIEEPSADRRDPLMDPLCGGCLYAHISYPRQLEIKGQVIADAFSRIGHIVLPETVTVTASPDEGYRMRARLHVRDDRVGFFREGTHDLCDARETRQLLADTCGAVERLHAGLRSLGIGAVRELEVSENVDASQRAIHLVAASPVEPRSMAALAKDAGLTGLTVSFQRSSSSTLIGGDPHVTDALAIDGHEITWRRHVLAFFQGNRYLVRELATHVVGQIDRGSRVIDLYAGAGLFSVSTAAVHGARVTAVEGDPVAVADLHINARQCDNVEVIHQPVEDFVVATTQAPDGLIVDPPRTGMSKAALDGAIRLRPRRIVYVSCDVATLARDSRWIVDAGYSLAAIDAFDMFPNTPHVETVVRFENV